MNVQGKSEMLYRGLESLVAATVNNCNLISKHRPTTEQEVEMELSIGTKTVTLDDLELPLITGRLHKACTTTDLLYVCLTTGCNFPAGLWF